MAYCAQQPPKGACWDHNPLITPCKDTFRPPRGTKRCESTLNITRFGHQTLFFRSLLGAGAILAIFITTLPLAVSAFTTRRVYAAAIVIGLFVISAATAGSLTECQEEHGGASNFQGCERPAGKAARWLALVDIGQVPSHVNRMIFADDAQARASELSVITAVRELNAAVPIGWYILMTAMPGFLLIWRYQSHRL